MIRFCNKLRECFVSDCFAGILEIRSLLVDGFLNVVEIDEPQDKQRTGFPNDNQRSSETALFPHTNGVKFCVVLRLSFDSTRGECTNCVSKIFTYEFLFHIGKLFFLKFKKNNSEFSFLKMSIETVV